MIFTYQNIVSADILTYEDMLNTINNLQKKALDTDEACLERNRYNVYMQFTINIEEDADMTRIFEFFRSICKTYYKQSEFKNFFYLYKNRKPNLSKQFEHNTLDFIKNLYDAYCLKTCPMFFHANNTKSYEFLLDETVDITSVDFFDRVFKKTNHVVMLDNCSKDIDDFALLYKIYETMRYRSYFTANTYFYLFNFKFLDAISNIWLKKITEIQDKQDFSPKNYKKFFYDFITLEKLCFFGSSYSNRCSYGYLGLYKSTSPNKNCKNENILYGYCNKNICSIKPRFFLYYKINKDKTTIFKDQLGKGKFEKDVNHVFTLTSLYSCNEFIINVMQRSIPAEPDSKNNFS
ncbi:hypothetical protein COBT_000755 [Conglomerata obtusa]